MELMTCRFYQGFQNAKTEEHRRAGEKSQWEYPEHGILYVVDQYRIIPVRDGGILQHGLERQFHCRSKFRGVY